MILSHLSCGSREKKVAELDMTAIVQLLLYRLKTGCQWRYLPIDLYWDKKMTRKWIYHHFHK